MVGDLNNILLIQNNNPRGNMKRILFVLFVLASLAACQAGTIGRSTGRHRGGGDGRSGQPDPTAE